MEEVFYRADHIPDEETDDWRATAEIIVDGVGMVHVLVYGDDRDHAIGRLRQAVETLAGSPVEWTETEDLIPYG